MALYQDIVNFLECKVDKANRSFLQSCIVPNPESEKEEMEKRVIDEIYELQAQLAMIKNECSDDELTLTMNINHILDEEVNSIVQGKITFDNKHALYGFETLHRRLTKAYIESEQYEKCIKIQNIEILKQ